MREVGFKRYLVEQMALRPGMCVLDLGCGTGTLTIMIKGSHPDVEVMGLDADPAVLATAQEKAARAGVPVRFELGLATSLPFADSYYDRVVSSLVFHHLTMPHKQLALVEVRRVLRPGGEVHILDFGKPYNLYTRLAAAIMRRFEETAEQLAGRLPALLAQSGFADVQTVRRFTTVFGPLASLKGLNP
jgi:ubiquinone/menaquinone biosynthesis C-methylase UbiE